MQHIRDAELAWSLIDIAKPKLDRRERNHVFICVGSGDSFTAMRIIIKLIVDKQIPLPMRLARLCAEWLETYVLHEDHQRLQELIDGLTLIDNDLRSPAIVRSFVHTRYPGDPAITADAYRNRDVAERAG